jgi:hypothetical protein
MLPCVDTGKPAVDRAARYKAKLERRKARYKANADCLNARRRALYAAKPDNVLAGNQAYRVKHPDKIKAIGKAYRAVKADDLKAKKKAYYVANRDDILAKRKVYYDEHAHDIKVQKHMYRRTKLGCIRCKEWPDGQRGWPHYDGYCWRCFSDKFRDDERVKTRGRVELKVRSYLDSHFKEFVHDQPIHTAHCVCSHRRRVDHRRLIGNTLLCIETDENFHRYYDPDDEEARYHDVIMAWGGKLCFVRFNPHKFNLDDRYDLGPPLAERLERLRAEVTRHVGRLERGENTAFLEVHHLYYPAGTEDYCEEEDGSTSLSVYIPWGKVLGPFMRSQPAFKQVATGVPQAKAGRPHVADYYVCNAFGVGHRGDASAVVSKREV